MRTNRGPVDAHMHVTSIHVPQETIDASHCDGATFVCGPPLPRPTCKVTAKYRRVCVDSRGAEREPLGSGARVWAALVLVALQGPGSLSASQCNPVQPVQPSQLPRCNLGPLQRPLRSHRPNQGCQVGYPDLPDTLASLPASLPK